MADRGGGGIRSSAAMIAKLAKCPAWVESMSPKVREQLNLKLEDMLARCSTPREVASVARAMVSLEKADVDRTRLFLESEKQGDDANSQDAALELLSDLRELRQRTEPDAD